MKKKISFVLLSILSIITLTACNNKEEKIEKEEKRNDPLPIAGMGWSRENGDTEILVFNENGHFTYYCTCGNPVDNADICETYTYNKKTNTITLDCDGKEDEKIKIVEYDEYKLKLEFESGIREFDRIAEE